MHEALVLNLSSASAGQQALVLFLPFFLFHRAHGGAAVNFPLNSSPANGTISGLLSFLKKSPLEDYRSLIRLSFLFHFINDTVTGSPPPWATLN